jgi:hypothetical protein
MRGEQVRSLEPQNAYSTVGSLNLSKIRRTGMRVVHRTRARRPRSFVEISRLSNTVTDRETEELLMRAVLAVV